MPLAFLRELLDIDIKRRLLVLDERAGLKHWAESGPSFCPPHFSWRVLVPRENALFLFHQFESRTS